MREWACGPVVGLSSGMLPTLVIATFFWIFSRIFRVHARVCVRWHCAFLAPQRRRLPISSLRVYGHTHACMCVWCEYEVCGLCTSKLHPIKKNSQGNRTPFRATVLGPWAIFYVPILGHQEVQANSASFSNRPDQQHALSGRESCRLLSGRRNAVWRKLRQWALLDRRRWKEEHLVAIDTMLFYILFLFFF
jgi:hypothetical protein